MDDLKQRIEQHLLGSKSWVSTLELETTFGVKERQLRQVKDVPGLCSDFAISGDKGFMHVSKASTTEWIRFKHRILKHAVKELRRLRTLDKQRHEVKRELRFVTMEKDTPQTLLRFCK